MSRAWAIVKLRLSSERRYTLQLKFMCTRLVAVDLPAKMTKPTILVALLVAVLCAACGSDSPSPSAPSPVPPGLGLSCPAPMTVTATGSAGVEVVFATPSPSGGVLPATVTCAPASGTTFPVGATTVRCTATDAAAATASCTFNVSVAPPAARLSETVFLAFGDSVTAGEVVVTTPTAALAGPAALIQPLEVRPEASYPTRLRELLAARYAAQSADIVVTNAGKSGERAADAPPRLGDLLANTRPQVVLLLHGYNDLARPGGTDPAIAAINAMAKDARFRGARLFIGSLTPPRPGGSRTLPDSTVRRYNERLFDVARGEGAVFVDLYAALAPDVTTWIGEDGLHPTEAGYRQVAQAFLDAIAANLQAPLRASP